MAEDNEQQSPFTRPGFVAATVVIALIVATMLLAGAWLHQAARRADGGAGR